MKWILLIELIYASGYGGGASVHTQYFSTEAQCETVARIFLNDHKERQQTSALQRTATCIKLKEE